MSQPTPPTDNTDNPRFAGELAYLGVAIAAIASVTCICVMDMLNRIEVPRGVYAILAAVFTVSAITYTIRSAQAKVICSQQRSAAEGDERERQGYAAGYIDGVGGRQPEPSRHLQSVN